MKIEKQTTYSYSLDLSFDTHIDDLLAFFQFPAKSRCLFISIKHKQTIKSTKKNLKKIMVRDGICGESANGSKNGRSHFKLMLCCLLLFIRPHIKFHQNRMKNTEVENFLYWSVLVGRAGRSKNACRHLKLFLCCFWSNISPHTKFHQNRTKNTEVENFHYWVPMPNAGLHEWNWLPNSDSKQIVMTSHHAKNQLDSSRRSRVIPSWKRYTTTTTPIRVEL